MKDYREMNVWQRSHQITLELYRLTKGFPKDEPYGRTSQMRRAAISKTAKIAEGRGRDGDAESKGFLSISSGPACELGLYDSDPSENLATEILEIRRMLGCSVQKLKA